MTRVEDQNERTPTMDVSSLRGKYITKASIADDNVTKSPRTLICLVLIALQCFCNYVDAFQLQSNPTTTPETKEMTMMFRRGGLVRPAKRGAIRRTSYFMARIIPDETDQRKESVNNHRQNATKEGMSDFRRTVVSLLSRGALATAAFVLLENTALDVQPSYATYSAYARREQDWQERIDKNEVQFSNAKSLRNQLREIAPMNVDEKSKIFCPNGPPSNVSPLMENKCGDRLATPSVYGRSDDTVGNSIPGFQSGWSSSTSSTGSLSSDVGGFPQYKK